MLDWETKPRARPRPQRRTAWDEAARWSMEKVVAAGREAYDRKRALPRLVRATPAELADTSLPMGRALLARLARALRGERNRGRAGHWTYDLNRHIALKQAYEAERRAMRRALFGPGRNTLDLEGKEPPRDTRDGPRNPE